jgi:hypothetical protein
VGFHVNRIAFSRFVAASLLPIAFVGVSFAQSDLLNTLRVRVEQESRIKVGAPVTARVLDDFYVHDELIVPKGTLVVGKITRVTPLPRRTRLNAMSRGDFTPLHSPEVRFTDLQLADGRDVSISAEPATDSSETVRFYARGGKHPSIFKQAWTTLLGEKDAAVQAVTAPGKKDRIEDFMYERLPWHPQEIEQNTVYELHLREPIALAPSTQRQLSSEKGVNKNALLKARLVTPLDSRKVKNGDAVAAIVTAPELDENQKVVVPEGSMLYGRVVNARAARSLGRNGALRFTFEKLQLPEGFEQQVTGVAKGVDSAHGRELAIDNEGGVQPPLNKSVIAPLALTLLSASALHEDEAPMAHAAASANGFGLITRIIAISTKSNTFGGVMGSITAARMIYSRFLAHGKDVKFERGTGIEVDLGRTHAPMSK